LIWRWKKCKIVTKNFSTLPSPNRCLRNRPFSWDSRETATSNWETPWEFFAIPHLGFLLERHWWKRQNWGLTIFDLFRCSVTLVASLGKDWLACLFDCLWIDWYTHKLAPLSFAFELISLFDKLFPVNLNTWHHMQLV